MSSNSDLVCSFPSIFIYDCNQLRIKQNDRVSTLIRCRLAGKQPIINKDSGENYRLRGWFMCIWNKVGLIRTETKRYLFPITKQTNQLKKIWYTKPIIPFGRDWNLLTRWKEPSRSVLFEKAQSATLLNNANIPWCSCGTKGRWCYVKYFIDIQGLNTTR